MGFLQWTNSWMIVFPIIVILYYFFRKKYKPQTVSSTLFWEVAMHETKASPYLKKLQKNALLFLQIAALLLFILAMMNPFFKSESIVGEQVIFIVDTSATMQAGVAVPLFDTYQAELLKLADDVEGKPVTLITSGSQPEVILRNERNSSNVKKAIENLHITYEAQSMSNVLSVAQSMIGDEATSVYVFTDAIDKTMIPVTSNNVSWKVYGQVKALDNVSITKLAAMQQQDVKTILVQVANDTSVEQRFSIILKDEHGIEIVEQVVIEPNKSLNHVFTSSVVGEKLTASIDVKDHYPVDNVAYTVFQEPSIEVQLDVDMHLLVQKGFASVYDDVVYLNEKTNADQRALIVTNKVSYLEDSQPVLLFGRNDVEAVEVNSFAKSSNHALFNFSSLDEVYVQTLYPPFEDYEVIATVGDEPFIQLSDTNDIIVLTDISATDWSLQPVFPLFLWSAIQEASAQSNYLGTFTPKQAASIVLPQKEWSLFNASQEFVQDLPSIQQVVAPEQPGFYTLKAADEERLFTVDLSADEKVIKQGENFTIGAVEVQTKEQQNRSLMLWIVPFILLLLLIEWEVQRRRGFTN
jgi:hypothetical protein